VTEQQQYQVVRTFPGFEVRRYPAHVVAEVELTGQFESAGNAAFRPLVSYISGRNRSGSKIAMTAPVIQEATEDLTRHRVSFVMPAGSTVADLPVPSASAVSVHEVPEQLAAVSRYSGRWTLGAYRKHVEQLEAEIQAAGLTAVGRPRYARFDPPWKPPFLRRNEVVIPIAEVGA
jgi:hypothetical protein